VKKAAVEEAARVKAAEEEEAARLKAAEEEAEAATLCPICAETTAQAPRYLVNCCKTKWVCRRCKKKERHKLNCMYCIQCKCCGRAGPIDNSHAAFLAWSKEHAACIEVTRLMVMRQNKTTEAQVFWQGWECVPA